MLLRRVAASGVVGSSFPGALPQARLRRTFGAFDPRLKCCCQIFQIKVLDILRWDVPRPDATTICALRFKLHRTFGAFNPRYEDALYILQLTRNPHPRQTLKKIFPVAFGSESRV